MTVAPKRVLTGGRAGGIEPARLGNDHERPVRMLSLFHRSFRRLDLGQRTAQVKRAGFVALRCGPGHRPIERPIDLERTGAVGEVFELSRIVARKRIAGDSEDLPRGEIEEHLIALRDLIEPIDPAIRFDRASERAKIVRHRIGNPLRTSARHRPTRGVPEHPEHQPERGRDRAIEREHRMRGHAGKERPRRFVFEARAGQPARRTQGLYAEPGQRDRVSRHRKRTEKCIAENVDVADKRSEQVAPARTVRAESCSGFVERPAQHRRAAVIEWVRERDRRIDPFQSEVMQWSPPKKRRCYPQRMNS